MVQYPRNVDNWWRKCWRCQ